MHLYHTYISYIIIQLNIILVISSQTRTLKLEKEALKSKARKSRDLFLIMLAENTVIDARTRWREASSLLQDDVRFKNVEDSRDREDLFNDFVSELEKKEKEDRTRQKSNALKYLEGVLEARRVSGSISRRSTWTEERDGMLRSQELHALDDAEVKRIFQDYVGRLDFTHKEEERQRKVELQRRVDVLTAEFRDLLEKLSYEGEITAASRWSECCSKPSIAESAAYRELEALSSVERKDGVVMGSSARETFEKMLVAVREASRADKRLVQDVLRDWEVVVRHNTTLQEFLDSVYTAAGVKTAPQLNAAPVVCDIAALTEDGEEVEEEVHVLDNGRVGFGKLLRSMLAKRPFALENIFSDLIDEERRRQAKRESNFLRLLEEYFFENPLDSWECCKRAVSRHPAYLDMMKIDREKVYQTFSASRLISKVKRKEERSRSREREGERTQDRDSRIKERKYSEEDSVRNHDGTYGISSSTVSKDHQKNPGSIESTLRSNLVDVNLSDDKKNGRDEGECEEEGSGVGCGEREVKLNLFLGKRENESVENISNELENGVSDDINNKKRKMDQDNQI
jgi:pre-mRNA-processing factor 40